MKRLCILLACLTLAACALAQDMAELEVDHNVNATFVTPHTDWATPYALGQARILFFCRGHGTDPREVVELKQRFDFDPQMIFWARVVDSTKEGWHGAENGVRRMARLLGQKWDAYVFMGVLPDKMPVEQQYPMIKAITQGAGLVIIGGNDPRLLKDKNKLAQAPPSLADVAGAAAFTVKDGRGVRLPDRPAIPYGPGWDVTYDQWAMRVGKAILWAAGKEPKLNLTLAPKGQELARATLPGAAATLAWTGAKGSETASVTLRREDGETLSLPAQPLKGAEGQADLAIPITRCGSYVLDVIARDGKNVAGFTSVPLKIVDPLMVTGLNLDRTWAEVGESFTGSVALSQPPAGANQGVRISVLDRRGRILTQSPVTPWVGGQKFTLKVAPWWPMLVRIQATIMDGGRELSSAWQMANVVKRHRNQFNFVMWDTPKGNLGPVAEESLARNGVTAHLRGGTPEPYIAAHDIAWVPYTTRILTPKDANGVMKPACWNDDAAFQAYVDEIATKYVPSRQHGVFVYSLGDEGDVRGSCVSPYCLEAYRRYLQEQYGDIAALNASWGSTYKSFDEVQLSRPDDDKEAEALRAGNFPRWYDRQAYQSYNFCKLCERFGAAFKRIDPDARCGFEGAGTFKEADDLDGFVRYNTFWSPYPGTADEVVRSIAPRDFPRSNWMGYTKDADSLLQKYWRMVTRGCDSVWWWRWDCIGRFHGWLAPNLDPYPAVQEILKDTRLVWDGLGDLLIHSEMQTDSIGILYSQPSAYAAQVQTSNTFGSYENNHSAAHAAVRGLGYNFLYFTDRQMRLGEVDLSKFKVIVLPLTQAMGPQEARMFRDYVQQGGTLIADVRPAIYDGHVKPLAAGQLDDLFGIKRSGAPEAAIVDGKIGDLELSKVRVDPAVAATTGKAGGAAGDTPLWLTNTVGKGRALLLNVALTTYPALGVEGTPEAAATQLAEVLTAAGLKPGVSLTNQDGRRLRNVEVTRWMNGPVQIVSVFRHMGSGEPAKLSLPRPMFVYDLKNGKALGKQQAINLTITPYRAMFYALSPEELKPARVIALPTATAGSAHRVEVSAAMPRGQQAVKVTVKLPDGSVADWVDEVVVADMKGAVVDVPVAYNDPKGKWTVLATDLYTGQTSMAQFGVK